MWRKLKEVHKAMDINNKYPGYFHKPIMWFGMIGVLIFVGLMVYTFGWGTTWVYVECESPLGCSNHFIDCQTEPETEYIILRPECDFYNSVECVGVNCDNPIIPYGDYAGTKPPFLVKYSTPLIMLLLAFVFLVNHLRYIILKKLKRLRY